ncbi:MAG: methylenetetrahydrofolate reductase [Geminicoccaceae bacterium]|nr:methylenetetrahydrofolate reductase [Geminicoccaceae bacterium]
MSYEHAADATLPGQDSDWSFAAPLPAIGLSIELFPPKTAGAARDLTRELAALNRLRPSFYTVTCGAGGTGNDATFEVVQTVHEETGLDVAAHMTCVGRAREDVDAQAERYWQAGVRRIIALRGDKPKDAPRYEPMPGGYAFAADLVAGLKRLHDFDVSVACYPEAHPESGTPEADLDHLLRKVDAGADRVVGQYCFDLERVLRFRDALAARGCAVPFVPGVMPIHNFRQVSNFSRRCGASIPEWLERLFAGTDENAVLHQMVAASVAAEQCRRLVAEGFSHLHIYALNRAELTVAIAHLLGRGEAVARAA